MIATLFAGRVFYNTTTLFPYGNILLFTVGKLIGVVLANASLDVALHDTIIMTIIRNHCVISWNHHVF